MPIHLLSGFQRVGLEDDQRRCEYSYMLTNEYDMLEFDFANNVNYSDLATLMAPRPFMVERGHDDGVAPDEWVAYEYAKVRRFYERWVFRTGLRSSSSTARTQSTESAHSRSCDVTCAGRHRRCASLQPPIAARCRAGERSRSRHRSKSCQDRWACG